MLTDPPYGIKLSNHDRGSSRSDRSFDVAGDESRDVVQYAVDWSRYRGIPAAVFASPWLPWLGDWRNLIVWDKGGAVGGGGDTATCLKRSWELIQVARNGPLNGDRCESVVRFPIASNDTPLHVCQKPIALMNWLIEKFTSIGDLLVDPFSGSGTTLRASLDCGRSCVGIEILESNCEIAANRLAQKNFNFTNQ